MSSVRMVRLVFYRNCPGWGTVVIADDLMNPGRAEVPQKCIIFQNSPLQVIFKRWHTRVMTIRSLLCHTPQV